MIHGRYLFYTSIELSLVKLIEQKKSCLSKRIRQDFYHFSAVIGDTALRIIHNGAEKRPPYLCYLIELH